MKDFSPHSSLCAHAHSSYSCQSAFPERSHNQPERRNKYCSFFNFYRSLKTGHLKVTAAMDLLLEIGLLHVKADLLCVVGEGNRHLFLRLCYI